MSGIPQRVGDRERDRAVEALRDHQAAGRLTMAEFDERMQTALTARTQADLEPLFVDLPEGPSHVPSISPTALTTDSAVPVRRGSDQSVTRSDRPAWVRSAWLVMWPAVMVASIVTGFQYWWLWLLPVPISMLLGSLWPSKSQR